MAALLTLDEAKLHCRIDHNDEDSLLGTLYEQRESQGDRQFYKNPTFENLLNPYRVHA